MTMTKTAAFITLGCKANRYDTGALMALCPPGVVAVDLEGDASAVADIYVINTCAVTGRSAYQCRQMVRRARKQNPAAKIIVTGCLAELEPDALTAAGADLVAGVSDRGRVAEWLGGSAAPGPVFRHPTGGVQPRGRAVVKVQDGCDRACSYCAVRLARGKSRSVTALEAVKEVAAVAAAGHAEVVLTGIHLGLWGRERGESLCDLLAALNTAPAMPARIRLSSLEPDELTDDLIGLLARSPLFCPHLHLPLQSGDADVLARMNRTYSPEEFSERVRAYLTAVPTAAVGLDVIAGFPRESDAAHRRTVELIASLPVAYLHVFPFSARPGTPAAKMAGVVDAATIKARAAELRTLGEAKRTEFMRARLGRTLAVLVERAPGGLASGTSAEYLQVRFAAGPETLRSIVAVRVTAARAKYIEGEVEAKG